MALIWTDEVLHYVTAHRTV